MDGYSPTQPKVEFIGMSFGKALIEVTNGKKITKKEWGDKNWYGFMIGDILKIHKPEGTDHEWIISKGDILGDDYFLV